MLIATVLDYDSGKTYTAHGERYDILAFFHNRFPSTRGLDTIEECVEALNQDGYYKAEVGPIPKPSNVLHPNTLSVGTPDDPWVREADFEGGNL